MSIYLLVSISLVVFGLSYEALNRISVSKIGNQAPKYLYTIPSFLLLFFISTFRGDFTTDYKNYSSLFELYNRYSFSELLNVGFQNEIGFIYLNKIIGLLSDNVIYFFAFMSFIILIGFFLHINKYSVNIWLSILMFVTAGSYYTSFNISRHIFAVAIIFLGSKFLYERNFIKWTIVVILASLFHKTAIIMIIFYFILNIRINIRNLVSITILSIVTILLLDNIVLFAQEYFYEQYTEDSYGMWGQALTNLVLPLSLLIFSLFHISKLDSENIKHRVWFNSLLFYNLFYILALQVEMVKRLGLFFSPYVLLLIPYIFSKMKDKHLRVVYMTGLIFILILYNYVVLSNSVFDPYYFVWENNKF